MSAGSFISLETIRQHSPLRIHNSLRFSHLTKLEILCIVVEARCCAVPYRPRNGSARIRIVSRFISLTPGDSSWSCRGRGSIAGDILRLLLQPVRSRSFLVLLRPPLSGEAACVRPPPPPAPEDMYTAVTPVVTGTSLREPSRVTVAEAVAPSTGAVVTAATGLFVMPKAVRGLPPRFLHRGRGSVRWSYDVVDCGHVGCPSSADVGPRRTKRALSFASFVF